VVGYSIWGAAHIARVTAGAEIGASTDGALVEAGSGGFLAP
jgi:hypothetical protein